MHCQRMTSDPSHDEVEHQQIDDGKSNAFASLMSPRMTHPSLMQELQPIEEAEDVSSSSSLNDEIINDQEEAADGSLIDL